MVKGRWIVQGLLVLIVTITILGCARTSAPVKFPTVYQAVLLGSDSVYYGKLTGYGTPTPVLTDVFYIVSQTDHKRRR